MLKAEHTTPLLLVEHCLERIAQIDKIGPQINAVIELNPAAKSLPATCPPGPLHGLPILIKDNIETADAMQTTAGSLALRDHPPKADAALVTRLRRHLKIRALLEVWLYVHVPLTFALIVALGAHIVGLTSAAIRVAQEHGAHLVGGFDGPELPERYARALREGRRGGAILFRRNLPDIATSARVCEAIRAHHDPRIAAVVAAILHNASSVAVVANSSRLIAFDPTTG